MTALERDLVGHRVVVRRVLRGETGPTGGPAYTDAIGILVAWSETEVTVRKSDDTTVTISQADIVAAKPVPPKPARSTRPPRQSGRY